MENHISAALDLRSRIADPHAIRHMVITAPVMDDVNRPQPRNGLEGKFSFQYTAAVALLDGTVNLRSYGEKRLFDPRLRELLKKISVVANDEFTHAYNNVPMKELARVTVVTRNGERRVGQRRQHGLQHSDSC